MNESNPVKLHLLFQIYQNNARKQLAKVLKYVFNYFSYYELIFEYLSRFLCIITSFLLVSGICLLFPW